MKEIDKFINDQLSQWPAALRKFPGAEESEDQAHRDPEALRWCSSTIRQGIVSSAANTDPDAIRHRKCFLCRASRPKEQFSP